MPGGRPLPSLPSVTRADATVAAVMLVAALLACGSLAAGFYVYAQRAVHVIVLEPDGPRA